MIHRLALLMGGTGAAGVLALALALGGFGAPLPNTPDAFAPVANDALGGGQLAADAPTDQPTMTTSLGGGGPQETPKKVIDTVYVLPAPAVVHSGKPATDANKPADTPREPRDDNNGGNNNGGNQAGDDQNGDEQGDDSSADDENEGSDEDAQDHNDDGDHSDDGGSDDGGQESGGD